MRSGRPKKWNDPKVGILASKKKYRDKKRLEKQRTDNVLVISYRCKQCGLEVKVNLMSETDLGICIWCEYDNSHGYSDTGSNHVTTKATRITRRGSGNRTFTHRE